MSRIDEALRKWEGGTAAPEGSATPADASASLSQFQREDEDQHRASLNEPPATPGTGKVQPFRPASNSRRIGMRGTSPISGDLEARLVTGVPNTAALEQYRRLAAVLHEQQVQSQLKTVMITSAVPNEGKTLTVVNLALTLSESYARRVLVIDADLRWPSLHSVLGIPNDRGLSEALRDGHQGLHLTEVSSRLSALTAGEPGPSPLAGLSSARMGEVLDECAARFDWVLIDTSPVGVLPDAQVLARRVGGVLLVIGAGSTPAAAIDRAVGELGGPEAILGTVLNRVEERRIAESGYYGQYGTSPNGN
jgi:protein-tyrosine kinase